MTFFNFNQREVPLVCPAQRPSAVPQRSLVPDRRRALWSPPSPGPGQDPARTLRRRITAPRGGGRRSGSRLRVRTRPRAAPKVSVLFTMEEAADGAFPRRAPSIATNRPPRRNPLHYDSDYFLQAANRRKPMKSLVRNHTKDATPASEMPSCCCDGVTLQPKLGPRLRKI